MEKTKEKAFSSIGVKSFLTVVIVLVIALTICGVLSNFIPQGTFETDENDAIIVGTYTQGEIKGIEFWRVLTAPVRVFASEDALTIIMISVFLLIMSGIFNLLDKTGGIKIFIGRIMHKLRDKGGPVVCVTVLMFMLFGSFFGMFEELVTLLPIVIMFMLCRLFATVNFILLLQAPTDLLIAEIARERFLFPIALRITIMVLN